MLSINEQKTLIEKYIQSNKNYRGNEDLLEDFCNEALQKSYMIFKSINNTQKLESYISKLVHTSILSVLKDYGRVRRDKTGYISTKEVKIEDFSNEKSEDIVGKGTYSSSFVWDFPDPKANTEEIVITRECLQKIADSVCIIHNEVPNMQFLNIFYLRYIKGYKQSEIGKELGLSQAEVSKRLMKLSKLISNLMDSGRS